MNCKATQCIFYKTHVLKSDFLTTHFFFFFFFRFCSDSIENDGQAAPKWKSESHKTERKKRTPFNN